jgi:hypothetical protein
MHRRPGRLALRALVACVPVLGLAVALGPVAGASTHATPQHATSQYAKAAAQARAFIRQLKVGSHATNHAVGSSHAVGHIKATTNTTSNNWAGYADLSNTYSTVTGKWTEPTVTCTSTTALAAFWVGIDGFSSGSVEQDGTLAECSGGSLFSFSWWEMYPTNAIQVVGSTVKAGDSITSSVVRSGSTYTLKVTDSTHTANSFTKTETCSSCANSSAEWIAEAPSGSAGIYPLPKFTTWTVSGATVKGGSTTGVISTFPNDKINMVNSSNQTKATTGPLNAAGNGFSVTWNRST